MRNLRNYLNSLFDIKQKQINNDITRIKANLTKPVNNLKEYVDLCKTLKESREQFGKMD